jgi:mannose-6-phosphate isomerase-like protein (cupin superfamily)
MRLPINFHTWIDEHRHLLKPPVGNQLVWQDTEFMIMVVGGPNSRKDYHINQGEEFFYQIEGDITLKIVEQGKPVDVPIRAGEIFLLPPNTPPFPTPPSRHRGSGHRAPAPPGRARRLSVVLRTLRSQTLRRILSGDRHCHSTAPCV